MNYMTGFFAYQNIFDNAAGLGLACTNKEQHNTSAFINGILHKFVAIGQYTKITLQVRMICLKCKNVDSNTSYYCDYILFTLGK